MRVERLVPPPRGGGETGETGVPYARGGKQAVENSVERGDDSDVTIVSRSAAAIPRRFGTTTTSAVVGGLLVTGSADGSVSFWDFSLKKEEEATARHEPSLVASLAHHACGVRAVAALPMAVEDAFASDADDARGGTRGNRTGNRRLGISVDGEGVVGVFSVTYARRDARGGVAKRARCEMLLRPRIDLRLTRDDVRRRTEPVDGVDGSGSEVPSSDDETREGNGFLQKAGVDDDVRLADVRLVWDARRGVLTALRGFRAKRTRGSRSSRSAAPYAVAYDILGNTVERSLEDDAALAFFAEARRRTGAAEMRVGDARGDVGWETNADASDDASDDTSDEFFGFERERRAGSVARARVVDVVALLTRASRAEDDFDDDDETRTVRSVASALHAWGRDEEADRAASDAFGVRCRSMPPFNAVLGEGNAVTVSVPVSGARHTLANDILSREWRDPRSDAERAVAVAACAARLAFVAARRFSRRDEDLKTRCSGDEGGDTKADEKADSERRTLERLHAAVARLSTSRTFTTPEHLAAFASLRHSPCVPIQDAAKALFRANVEDVEDVDTSASVVDARCDLSHQVLESARAAVAAAEASLASEADAVRHLRAGAGPEACRGASRKAKALAEEAVRLAAPVVVAAARRVYSARDAKQKKTSEKTSEKKSVSNLVRALVALLAAPHAVLVADAASLLAEGVDLNGWSNALSETELVSLQTETFALADAFGGIGGLFAHSSSRSFVASRATEMIAARDATHALLATLASERPASFVAHLARRLARARRRQFERQRVGTRLVRTHLDVPLRVRRRAGPTRPRRSLLDGGLSCLRIFSPRCARRGGGRSLAVAVGSLAPRGVRDGLRDGRRDVVVVTRRGFRFTLLFPFPRGRRVVRLRSLGGHARRERFRGRIRGDAGRVNDGGRGLRRARRRPRDVSLRAAARLLGASGVEVESVAERAGDHRGFLRDLRRGGRGAVRRVLDELAALLQGVRGELLEPILQLRPHDRGAVPRRTICGRNGIANASSRNIRTGGRPRARRRGTRRPGGLIA